MPHSTPTVKWLCSSLMRTMVRWHTRLALDPSIICLSLAHPRTRTFRAHTDETEQEGEDSESGGEDNASSDGGQSKGASTKDRRRNHGSHRSPATRKSKRLAAINTTARLVPSATRTRRSQRVAAHAAANNKNAGQDAPAPPAPSSLFAAVPAHMLRRNPWLFIEGGEGITYRTLPGGDRELLPAFEPYHEAFFKATAEEMRARQDAIDKTGRYSHCECQYFLLL